MCTYTDILHYNIDNNNNHDCDNNKQLHLVYACSQYEKIVNSEIFIEQIFHRKGAQPFSMCQGL